MEHQDWDVTVIRKPKKHIQKQHIQNETEKTSVVSQELASQIIAGRTALKMSRSDLALKINEQESLVTRYETRKEIPKNHILQKMRKVLGCKLISN